MCLEPNVPRIGLAVGALRRFGLSQPGRHTQRVPVIAHIDYRLAVRTRENEIILSLSRTYLYLFCAIEVSANGDNNQVMERSCAEFCSE